MDPEEILTLFEDIPISHINEILRNNDDVCLYNLCFRKATYGFYIGSRVYCIVHRTPEMVRYNGKN